MVSSKSTFDLSEREALGTHHWTIKDWKRCHAFRGDEPILSDKFGVPFADETVSFQMKASPAKTLRSYSPDHGFNVSLVCLAANDRTIKGRFKIEPTNDRNLDEARSLDARGEETFFEVCKYREDFDVKVEVLQQR